MMEQENPGNIPPEMSVKRKRGRPRKDQSRKRGRGAHTMMIQPVLKEDNIGNQSGRVDLAAVTEMSVKRKRGRPRKDQSRKRGRGAHTMMIQPDLKEDNNGNQLGRVDLAAVTEMSVKRKRGRPRKDQSRKRGRGAHTMMIQPVLKEDNNGNQSRRFDLAAVTDDDAIGKIITGVADATFNGGYLINVKIDDTETILLGVVFEPGQHLLSAEINVDPARNQPQQEVAKPTKPSETISSDPNKEHVDNSTSVIAADSRYLEESKMRRMSALLQVLQDSMMENEARDGDEMKNDGKEKVVQSKTD